MTEEVKQNTLKWSASWDDHEIAQLESWLLATPAERLAWLEETLKFIHQTKTSKTSQSEKQF